MIGRYRFGAAAFLRSFTPRGLVVADLVASVIAREVQGRWLGCRTEAQGAGGAVAGPRSRDDRS